MIRTQILVACDPCRKAKIRCDGQGHCKRCLKSAIRCTLQPCYSCKASASPCTGPLIDNCDRCKREGMECQPTALTSQRAFTFQADQETKVAKLTVAPPTKSNTAAQMFKTECNSCRQQKISCKGLETGPKCARCLELDLECNCRVLRRGCGNCRKVKSRCSGYQDTCDRCIRYGENCLPYELEPPSARKKEPEISTPTDPVTWRPLDAVDGMKLEQAFQDCENCLSENSRCDRGLPDCGSCGKNLLECKYESEPLSKTISSRSNSLQDPALKFS